MFQSILLLLERNLMIGLIFIEVLFNIVSREQLARILEIFGGLFESAHWAADFAVVVLPAAKASQVAIDEFLLPSLITRIWGLAVFLRRAWLYHPIDAEAFVCLVHLDLLLHQADLVTKLRQFSRRLLLYMLCMLQTRFPGWRLVCAVDLIVREGFYLKHVVGVIIIAVVWLHNRLLWAEFTSWTWFFHLVRLPMSYWCRGDCMNFITIWHTLLLDRLVRLIRGVALGWDRWQIPTFESTRCSLYTTSLWSRRIHLLNQNGTKTFNRGIPIGANHAFLV